MSSLGGVDRPSPRHISNMLVGQAPNAPTNDRALSAFIYIWGQFLDHDIDLTGPAQRPAPKRATSPCRTATCSSIPTARARRRIPLTPLAVRPDDRHQRRQSARADQPDHGLDRRLDDLRLRPGNGRQPADVRRRQAPDQRRRSAADRGRSGFLAGDVRANENIELTSMHALFVREHNWLAAEIAPRQPRPDRRANLPARPAPSSAPRSRSSPTRSSCPRCSATARSTATRLRPDGRPEHRQRVLDRRVPAAQPDQRRRRVLRQRRPRRSATRSRSARRSTIPTC